MAGAPLVLNGFFAPRAVPVPPEAADPPLFLRFELAPLSWEAFQRQLEGHPRAKALYLVRHAEGTHNAKDKEVGTPRWEAEFARTDEFLDADLTPLGVRDAQRKGPGPLRAELARGMPPIERVVVSPMSRAIQTAQHFLADLVPQPFVAMELCRERLGVHTCDKRRTLSELRSKFPAVNFDYKSAAMTDEQDVWWKPDHRETNGEIEARAGEFLKQLFELVPERHVAVVAHSGFIEAVCAITLGQNIHAANCEIIPVVLEMPDNA